MTNTVDLERYVPREFLNSIKPKIQLIGSWDDYFSIIKKQYRWADHLISPPGRIDDAVSLIVVNNKDYYHYIVESLLENSNGASVIVYDESEQIIFDSNHIHQNLICYLKKSAPRYINGHIRSMLQLKRWYLGRQSELPIIISSQEQRDLLYSVFKMLDLGHPINLICPDSELFQYHFQILAKATHYEKALFVNSSDEFDSVVNYKYTTLILNISNKEEYGKYKKKALMEFSVVFVAKSEQSFVDLDADFTLSYKTNNVHDYYLSAYYFSLLQNLNQRIDQTAFIQVSDMSRAYEKESDYFGYMKLLSEMYESDELTPKNMSPMIRGVSYGLLPLDSLIRKLVNTIYGELFAQTNHALEHAEMLSSVSRSKLQHIAGKINTEKE